MDHDDHHDIVIDDDGAETGTVVLASDRQVDGIDLSTTFVFARDNLDWVVAELEAAEDAWGYGGADEARGDDHFFVRGGGTDDEPIINFQNERGGDMRAGVYSIAMNQATSVELRGLLGAL